MGRGRLVASARFVLPDGAPGPTRTRLEGRTAAPGSSSRDQETEGAKACALAATAARGSGSRPGAGLAGGAPSDRAAAPPPRQRASRRRPTLGPPPPRGESAPPPRAPFRTPACPARRWEGTPTQTPPQRWGSLEGLRPRLPGLWGPHPTIVPSAPRCPGPPWGAPRTDAGSTSGLELASALPGVPGGGKMAPGTCPRSGGATHLSGGGGRGLRGDPGKGGSRSGVRAAVTPRGPAGASSRAGAWQAAGVLG